MTTPEDPLSQVFRCSHFTCVLTHRACLRRQAETWRKPGRGPSGKHFVVTKPMHPHCASGACAQGNAIRAQFPGHVPDRPADPRAAPRLDLVEASPKETAMPKGRRAEPCPHCKTTSTRCAADCPTRKKPASSAAAPTPGPRVVRRGADALPEPAQLPDEYLVACVAEARDRVARRRAEADRLEQLLAGDAAPAVRSAG